MSLWTDKVRRCPQCGEDAPYGGNLRKCKECGGIYCGKCPHPIGGWCPYCGSFESKSI